LSYDFACLHAKMEPLPAKPFMAGRGGGWVVKRLVLQDRSKV
jgi:hypothetical protein